MTDKQTIDNTIDTAEFLFDCVNQEGMWADWMKPRVEDYLNWLYDNKGPNPLLYDPDDLKALAKAWIDEDDFKEDEKNIDWDILKQELDQKIINYIPSFLWLCNDVEEFINWKKEVFAKWELNENAFRMRMMQCHPDYQNFHTYLVMGKKDPIMV